MKNEHVLKMREVVSEHKQRIAAMDLEDQTPDGQDLRDGPCTCNVECANQTEDLTTPWCTCGCHRKEYR